MNPKYLPNTKEERRWHLAEECAEVIKELSKVARFGLEGDEFVAMAGVPTPRERLIEELKDLEAAIARVKEDLNPWNDQTLEETPNGPMYPVENG